MNAAVNSSIKIPKGHQVLHLWIVALILDLCIAIFNANFIDISGWFPWSTDVTTAHGVALFVLTFIFIIPIVYTSIVFGLRGTILVWLIFLIATLPRTIMQVQSLADWLGFWLFALVALLLGLLISLAMSATRKEKALRQAAPRSWLSASRIIKAQEAERKRIARELHDDTIQDLLVIVNHLHALETGIHGDLPRETRNRIEGIENETLHVIDNMRRMSHGLRTSMLDNTGLVPALKWLAESMTHETGINVTVTVNGREHKLKSESEVLIFRIAQEALSNVKQHSRATHAEINLDFAARNIKLIVKDNGCGFNLPENNGSATDASQVGLDIIRQRVKLLGGTLNIQTGQGKGTTLVIETNTV